jgi:hypothetical protein
MSKFHRAKRVFAKAANTSNDKQGHQLIAEGLMHLTEALAASAPAPARPEIDRTQVYERLVSLIEARPGSPKVSNPYDLLIDDLGFEKQTLADFAAQVNASFSDLKVNISRQNIGKCMTVVDLANAIADDAESHLKS